MKLTAKRGKTILIVDDDFPVRQLFSKIFRDDGHAILPAGTGREALRMLHVTRPDLMFLDVRLPDIEGFAIMRAALKLYPDLPIIAITGFEDEGLAREFMIAGARDFIMKPIDVEYLKNSALPHLL